MAMTIRLKVSRDNSITETLKAIGSKIDNGDEWYFLPFWFKHIGGGVYELYGYDELPESTREAIKQLRGTDKPPHTFT